MVTGTYEGGVSLLVEEWLQIKIRGGISEINQTSHWEWLCQFSLDVLNWCGYDINRDVVYFHHSN